MKALDPRLLRHAAASRRYLAISSLVAVTSGLLVIVAAFAISELVVLAFQDRAGLVDMRGPLIVLGLAVLGRALLAWAGQVAAHRAAADVKSAAADGSCSGTPSGSVLRGWLASRWVSWPRWRPLARMQSTTTSRSTCRRSLRLPSCRPPLSSVVLSQDVLAGVIILGTLSLIPLFGVLIGRGTAAGDATSMAHAGRPRRPLPRRRPGPAHAAAVRSSQGAGRSDSPAG